MAATELEPTRWLEVGDARDVSWWQVSACLHQASASMQSQRCNDSCDTVVIEINGNKWSHYKMELQPILE